MGNILHKSQSATSSGVLSNVGENVRRLRAARKLSQVALADAAGLSRRMIAAIENDDANLSLSTLDRIAAALQCSLTTLIRSPNSTDNRRIESVAWTGGQEGSTAMLLGSAPATREAELWLWSLGEGERYASEANSQDWHEMIFVVSGRLLLETSEETVALGGGDFKIFSSARPYVFANGGPGMTRFIRTVIL